MSFTLLNVILFVLICILLTILDIHRRKIPNIIVLPAIFMGVLLTGNYIWALIMFIIGAVYYYHKKWGGGDVKMLSFIGAFIGIKAIGVFFIFFILMTLIKKRWVAGAIPCAPFLFISSIPFIW